MKKYKKKGGKKGGEISRKNKRAQKSDSSTHWAHVRIKHSHSRY